jgi:hypothetical protein
VEKRAGGKGAEDDPSVPEVTRSRIEVETDLAPLQSQTCLKRLPGFRLEALEQRAATLF